MQKFIIDRKTWLRGEEGYNSALKRKYDGKECCLGQIAKQCEFDERNIIRVASPQCLVKICETQKQKEFVNKFRKDTGARMMAANDNPRTTDKQKEKRLNSLAAKIGVKLVFKN